MISARMIGTAAFGMLLGLVGTMPSGHAEPVRSEPSTTTPSATAAPTTTIAPPTSRPAGATSGDQTPSTIDGSCALRGAAVTCTWASPSNPGVVRLLMLRGDGKVGRAFGPFAPMAGSATDATVRSGITYSFVVVGLDATNKSIAHSQGTIIAVQ